MTDIRWTLNVQVTDGPTAARADQITVDAYDKIDITVPAGESDMEVQIGPTDADLKLLMMAVQGLGDLSDLTYKVNANTADANTADSSLLFLLGDGAIALLSSPATPRTLFFSNASTNEDASIEILVGRDATP